MKSLIYLELVSFVLMFWKWQDFLDKLKSFGLPGLFAISMLDSSFVPIPGGPDLLLVTISAQSTVIETIGYVLAATIGSTIGCTIIYLIARRGGESILKHVSEERRAYIQGLLGRYDALALVVASILPPPFPFKPFVLMSGVLNFRLPRFIGALFIGRALRYLVLGMLALHYGKATIDMMRKNGPWILLGLAVIGGLVYLLRYFRARGQNPTSA